MVKIKTADFDELLAEGTALLALAGKDSPRLDAEILLSHALGIDRLELPLYAPLKIGHSAENLYVYGDHINRRAAGEPVAYIIGKKEFYKSAFFVNRSVMIPRPETEEMVEAILNRFDGHRRISLLDVGAGCGCIALSLVLERPDWKITACDVSPDALLVAKQNARNLGAGNVEFTLSDLFDAVNGKFDLIVSNPPYVDEKLSDTLQVEVREYEPSVALFAGDGGMKVIKTLVDRAADYLEPGGVFYCEIGYDQKEKVEKHFDENVWTDVEFSRDLAGNWRTVTAVCGMK